MILVTGETEVQGVRGYWLLQGIVTSTLTVSKYQTSFSFFKFYRHLL